MTYAISGLKVVNPSRTRRGGAMTSLGYIAPEAAIVHSRRSQATNTDFSRRDIAMPLFGRAVSGYHYGSQPVRLGLYTGITGTTPTSQYGTQPVVQSGVEGFMKDLPPWIGQIADVLHDVTGQIVGDNPSSGVTPEDTENKDITVPAKEPGTMFGMDTKTMLLLAGGALAVYLLAKKG